MLKPARLINYLILLALSVASFSSIRANQDGSTRQVMDDILSALKVILPLSLSDEKFMKSENQAVLREKLKILADNAKHLPEHGPSKDETFQYLSNSLAGDARAISRLYNAGKYKQARFQLDFLTENCVACHSRMPSMSSQRASGLFDDVSLKDLDSAEKAKLLLATRQFDKAAIAYADILTSDATNMDRMVMSDWVMDFLIIKVRVQRDYKGASATLDRLSKRADLPQYLQDDMRDWQVSLKKFAANPPKKSDLVSIRKLISEAKELALFPLDRRGVIQYLLASSLIHEYVQTAPKGERAAEAYYLLGLTESMTSRTFWLAQNSYYLEVAIRSAPASIFAERAYRSLEENALFENSGSAGIDIPDDVQDHLLSLRNLIREAKNKKRHK